MLKYLSNPVNSFVLRLKLFQSPVNKLSLIFFSFGLLSLLLRSLCISSLYQNYLYNVNNVENTIELVKGMLTNEKNIVSELNHSYSNKTIQEPYIIVNDSTSLLDTDNDTIENKTFSPPIINFTNYDNQIQLFLTNILNLTQLSLSLTNTTLQTNFSSQTSVIDSKIEKLLRTSLTINNNNGKNLKEYTVNYTDLVSENLNILQGVYGKEMINLESKIDNFTKLFFQDYLNHLTDSLNQFQNENKNKNISNNITSKTNNETKPLSKNSTFVFYNNSEKYNKIEYKIDVTKDFTIFQLLKLHEAQADQLNKLTTQNLIIFSTLALLFIAFTFCKSWISHALEKRYYSYYENSHDSANFCSQHYEGEHSDNQSKIKISIHEKYDVKDILYNVQKRNKETDLCSKQYDVENVECQNQEFRQRILWADLWFALWLINKYYLVVSDLLFYNIFAMLLRGLLVQYLSIIYDSNHDCRLVINNFLQKIGAEISIQLKPITLNDHTYLDNISFYFNISLITLLLVFVIYLLLGYMLHIIRK